MIFYFWLAYCIFQVWSSSKANKGLEVKIFFSSSQCSMIFQLEFMNFLILGFLRLYLVTITGGFFANFISCTY